MARETRRSLSTNQTGEIGGRGEVQLQVAPPVAAPQRLNTNLRDILDGFEPLANAHFKKEHEAEVASESAAAAVDATNLPDGEAPDLRPEQTVFYQEAYMAMHGRRAAMSDGRELASAYENDFDKDGGDIEDFMVRFRESRSNNLDDATYAGTYLPTMQQAEQALRNAHQEYQLGRMQQEVQTGFFDMISETMRRASDGGRSMTPQELQVYFQDGREFFDMDSDQLDAVVFEAAKNAAMIQKDPTVLDVLYEKQANGSPGLASNPKYAEKIRAARDAAARAAAVKTTKVNQSIKYGLLTTIKDMIRNGEDISHEIAYGISNGLLTASEASGHREAYLTELEEIKKRQLAEAAIRANNMQLGAGLDNSYMDDAMLSVADEIMARAAEDPSLLNQSIGEVIDLSRKNGLDYSRWKKTLNDVDPGNTKTFHGAADLYARIKAVSPIYAQRLVSDDAATMFNVYHDRVNFAGMDPDEAREAALRVSTSDNEQMVRSYMSSPEAYTVRSEAVTELTDLPGLFAGNANNPHYVSEALTRLARMNLSYGNSDLDSAYEFAKERFEATHAPINGRWAFVGNQVVPDALTDAADNYVDTILPERLLADGFELDEEGYYLAPDATTLDNGTWGVFRESSDFPLMIRVDPKKLTAAYLRSQTPTRDQVEADRLSNVKPETFGQPSMVAPRNDATEASDAVSQHLSDVERDEAEERARVFLQEKVRSKLASQVPDDGTPKQSHRLEFEGRRVSLPGHVMRDKKAVRHYLTVLRDWPEDRTNRFIDLYFK